MHAGDSLFLSKAAFPFIFYPYTTMNYSQKFFAALALPVVGLSMAAHTTSAQMELSDQDGSQEDRMEKRMNHGNKSFKKHNGMQKFKDEVTHTVEKLSNGVKATITTQNAELLEKLQSRTAKDKNTAVTTTVALLADGVEITKTTDDAEAVAQMHERVDKHEARKAQKDSITRTVENTANGVVITIVSTNAEVTEKIQSKPAKESKNESVTVLHENIDGGVQITIFADDAETIEKIQQRSEDGKGNGKRKGRKGGKNGKKGMRSAQ
jgi:acylphosphatase